jgi:hypothetical protein
VISVLLNGCLDLSALPRVPVRPTHSRHSSCSDAGPELLLGTVLSGAAGGGAGSSNSSGGGGGGSLPGTPTAAAAALLPPPALVRVELGG